MAFVRLLKELMKDPEIGERFVPIIPDEARTFGMDSLFPTAKIYSPHGQTYDARSTATCCCRTRSPEKGQILHEGISGGRGDGVGHRGGVFVYHPWHAHDPGVRVLLDVSGGSGPATRCGRSATSSGGVSFWAQPQAGRL